MLTAFLHYTAPPVVGGVEAVMHAHAAVFDKNGYPVTVIAGRGRRSAFPEEVGFIDIPEMDTQFPEVLALNPSLERGEVPAEFDQLVVRLKRTLFPVLRQFQNVIVHNIFSKHFNLPLTAALAQMAEEGALRNCISWSHDFTWSSPNSRHKVHPGYPWDLLRQRIPGIRYVVVSEKRRQEFAQITGRGVEDVQVVYNGVDFNELLGLSPEGAELAERLELDSADLILLMPVRVTQAKNIEYALETTAALKALGFAPRLVITGPPDPHSQSSMQYFESLREKRAQLGLENEARFVYESGPHGDGFTIDTPVVFDLLRTADLMLMPSHREGFGMPVLEAGLAGVHVVVQQNVPAAVEIAEDDVALKLTDQTPQKAAEQIGELLNNDSTLCLRRKVRKGYTWQRIFKGQVEGLLVKGELTE